MYTAFLKRFGENFEKMFGEFFLMPPFQIQTEAAHIWLGVFIVLVSGLSTYQAQYHSICNDNVFELFDRPLLGRHWTRFHLWTLRRHGRLWTVRPVFYFPDRLGRHWTRFRLRTLRRRGRFNLHFDRQFSSDMQPFKPFTCILALPIAGMSNVRPAGRMRPVKGLNAARE